MLRKLNCFLNIVIGRMYYPKADYLEEVKAIT